MPYIIILIGLPDYFAMSVRKSNTVEAYFYLLFSWLSSCDTLFFNSKREKKKQKLTIFVLIAQRDTLHEGRAGYSRLMASYKKKMGPILRSGLFVIQTYRQRQSDRQFDLQKLSRISLSPTVLSPFLYVSGSEY